MIPSSTNTSLIDILESLLKYLIITGKLPFKAFAKTSVELAARRAFFKKFMIYKLNLASWQFMFLESIVKNLKEREIIIQLDGIDRGLQNDPAWNLLLLSWLLRLSPLPSSLFSAHMRV